MKKGLFSAFIAVAFLLVGCNPPVETKISIEPAALSLSISQMQQLVAVVTPEGTATQITWTSSNPEVATVDNYGRVTAIADGTTIITASAEDCEAGECQVTVSTPTSFTRKFLIEHFTGDQCGYCPGGMYAIVERIKDSNVPYIWVSHHYGYNSDEYTISESSKIGKSLGVSGAPNMALNRTKVSGNSIAFHPGYLSESIEAKCETQAEASVVIYHNYDANTRQLDINVSGYVVNPDVTEYLLTVLVKENRLVGKQADYEYSWKTATWKEYMHARVARDFVTNHFGDTVAVENNRYSRDWTFTLSEKWIAENCCVVAYLTPLAKKPIINAEQAPVVIGTMGGEQYYPYGITEGKGPNTTVAFDSIAYVQLDKNLLEVQLYASKSIKATTGSAKAVGLVHLNTEATTLQPGTYSIQEDKAAGSITAGYRVDEQCTLGGSRLVYALSNSLKKGEIVPAHQWRMQSGTMVVDANGDISLDFTTYSGTQVTATYISAQ